MVDFNKIIIKINYEECVMKFKDRKINSIFLVGLGFLMYGLFSQYLYAHGMSEADKQAIIEGGNLKYMQLGITHMLSGYDHLAFVFGIIFFLSSFKDIAKYVTAFTLGHSVTLIYATFNAIQMNYFLIDAVIGLSVSYIAFSNIDGFKKYLGIKPPNMMVMITSLGLIHGFGLSTRLQALPLSEDELLLNIISFNVGIEIGQISALAAMLILIAAWRNKASFKPFSLIANYSLILLGIFLFLMQMHGYTHTAHPDEFITSKPVTESIKVAADPVMSMSNTASIRSDMIEIEIPARDSKEYKFHLVKGSYLNYEWKTDGAELFFDFHGEPDGDTTGYFESFKKQTNNTSSGKHTASFDGTHGWYWKNKTTSPVKIILNVTGTYSRTDLEKIAEDDLRETQNSETRNTIY
jgi:hypothetical protein